MMPKYRLLLDDIPPPIIIDKPTNKYKDNNISNSKRINTMQKYGISPLLSIIYLNIFDKKLSKTLT